MEMSKGFTSKDDITVAADNCEYLNMKFIECDVRLNFREVEVMDLLIENPHTINYCNFRYYVRHCSLYLFISLPLA